MPASSTVATRLRALLDSPLARGAGQVLAVQVIAAGLGYVMQVLLARWMGTATYGMYTYAISWGFLLSTLGSLGVPTLVLRFIPQYTEEEQPGLLRGLLYASPLLVLGGSVLLAGLASGVVWLMPSVALSKPALILGFWTAPLLALMTLLTEMLRARRHLLPAYAPPRLLRPGLLVAAALLLPTLLPAPSALTVLVLFAGALLVTVLIQSGSVLRRLMRPLRNHRLETAWRRWLSVTLPLLAAQGTVVLLVKTDILLIGAFLSPTEVGIYNAALQTTHVASFLAFAVEAVAAPVVVRLHTSGDTAAIQAYARRLAHWHFWPALMTSIVLALLSRPILALFGPSFVRGVPVMYVLLAGQLVNAATGLASGSTLSITGYERATARIYGWSLLLNVVLNLVGLHLFGLIGAALATALSLTVRNLWVYVIVVRRLNVYTSIVDTLFRYK